MCLLALRYSLATAGLAESDEDELEPSRSVESEETEPASDDGAEVVSLSRGRRNERSAS
jgi:hypothetical protein